MKAVYALRCKGYLQGNAICVHLSNKPNVPSAIYFSPAGLFGSGAAGAAGLGGGGGGVAAVAAGLGGGVAAVSAPVDADTVARARAVGFDSSDGRKMGIGEAG
jgi:hypothetical protein